MFTEALLFDLDGTLTDSDPIHMIAFVEIGRRYGVAIDEAIFREHISGQSNRLICRNLFGHVDPALWDGIADAKEARFREMIVGKLTPIPGLVGFLARERARGAGCAVVSNAPRANVVAMLAALGLTKDFDAIVLGSELPRSKPDPLPYLTALETLGVPANRAVAFEDAVPGLLAAARSGVATVGLTTSLDGEAILATGAHLAIPDYDAPELQPFVDAALGRPAAVTSIG
ncbi:HAD family hydrolase [Siculibacillus lacustris]|uniref:HAD family hydrolase n=1 Tax=Siculibacillus lacustris TaxID=1549641 RepID=A0A4Q9W094_9HYPH|nr:HAD-IA family hydrolase [Siculibacillus lacustris]TBW41413.1 HAD family hydrolase [Siculibacillus lacustris]